MTLALRRLLAHNLRRVQIVTLALDVAVDLLADAIERKA